MDHSIVEYCYIQMIYYRIESYIKLYQRTRRRVSRDDLL